MVSLEKAVIARLTKNSLHFEILVDPDAVLEIKKGKSIPIEDVLAANVVFRDARKGERAPDEDLEKAFKTNDTKRITEEIIKRGDVQLTTEQRRRMVEEKKTQIADIISRQGVNPQTKLPHPQSRILNAMEEARVNIDPFKPANEQMQAVLEKIRSIIPISFETIQVAVKIPIEYAGKASVIVHKLAPVKKEEWRSDAWIALIEIPAGMQADIYQKLNDLTAGKVEVKVVG